MLLQSIHIEFYNKSITERLCMLNTATLSMLAHLCQSQHKTPWITFRGHSRSRILGSLNSQRWTALLLYNNLAPFHRYCRFLRSWPHLYSTLIFGVFPLYHIAHVGVSRSINRKLISHDIIFEVCQLMWSRYPNVKDGQNVSAIQGHPRSLILVPIDSAYATSH